MRCDTCPSLREFNPVPMIQIIVNGKNVEIESPMTIEQLLEAVDVPPNYLAVELNAHVVPA